MEALDLEANADQAAVTGSDPVLDACVAMYKEVLDEDGQVEFKGAA